VGRLLEGVDPAAPGRILVAEDEAPLARVYARVLVADGFEVHTASDGAQALSWLLASPYDVLVSDVCMPRMTGLELLRQVRLSLPELPVVLLTGQLDAEAYGQARDLGSVRYLLKPVGMEQLARAVRSAYDLRASWIRTKMRRAGA
jgi:DNA-binding NtrC family response regulator